MLKSLRLARPFPVLRSTVVPFRNQAIACGPCLNRKVSTSKRKTQNQSHISLMDKYSPELTKEETEIFDRLAILVSTRKFDDLFGSLNDNPSLTIGLFEKVMQAKFGIMCSEEIELMEEILKIMWEREVQPTASCINPLIHLYGIVGALKKADALLDMMKENGIERDPVTYKSLMNCRVNDRARVAYIYYQMIEDGLVPNVDIYNSMIKTFGKSGDLKRATEMFAVMKRAGINADATTFSIIFNCFAKSGKHVREMKSILKEMKDSSVVPDTRIWTNIIEGFSRADKEGDQKKALLVWKYISGQLTHESLGMSYLPIKTSDISPNSATLSVALDVCKFGRFEKEAHEVWMFGQENESIALNPNVLTTYVEALVFFGVKGADRVIELILKGIKGEDMPLRCVRPDRKTTRNALQGLKDNRWREHAAKLHRSLAYKAF